MSEPDYYRILNLDPQADTKAIRTAYLKRLRETHPDAGGDSRDFHLVQTAWETLSHPGKRREYDLAHFGKKAARRYGKATRGQRRRPHSWRINPNTPPESQRAATDTPDVTGLVALPWHSRIRPERLTHTPSLNWRAGLALAAALSWAITSLLYTQTLFAATDSTLLQATTIPLLTGTGLLTTHAATRPAKPRPHIAGPALTTIACALILWITNASPVGITFTLHAAACLTIPYAVRRLRLTWALRNAIKPALSQYNAFAPPGQQPRADRATGALLRELLTHLPAARLFAAVPTNTGHHADYLVLAGNRAALIASPIPRHPNDASPETLPDILTDLHNTLPTIECRGWIIWSTLPDDRIQTAENGIGHLPADQAASDIGTWLAPGAHKLHLPTIRRLRDRLTDTHTPQTHPDATPV